MNETFFSLFFDYVDKGGFVFVLLFVFSVISLAIILYKFIQFFIFNRLSINDLENKIVNSNSLNDFEENNRELLQSNHPILLIVKYSINMFNHKKLNENDRISAISAFSSKQIKKIEFLLPSLEIIAQVSPLLGLLGTVIGMISSFNQLEIGGSLVDPAVLAGGIWTALLTTAVGLIVAIPSLIAHYFFEKKIISIQQTTNNLLILVNNLTK